MQMETFATQIEMFPNTNEKKNPENIPCICYKINQYDLVGTHFFAFYEMWNVCGISYDTNAQ